MKLSVAKKALRVRSKISPQFWGSGRLLLSFYERQTASRDGENRDNDAALLYVSFNLTL